MRKQPIEQTRKTASSARKAGPMPLRWAVCRVVVLVAAAATTGCLGSQHLHPRAGESARRVAQLQVRAAEGDRGSDATAEDGKIVVENLRGSSVLNATERDARVRSLMPLSR